MSVFENIKNVYLIGIGGIGMSAIARYFKSLNKSVAGYDKTSSTLILSLISEDISIHFDDNTNLIPESFIKQKSNTIIIYTPAIPNEHSELNYFINNSFQIYKRSEILGIITEPMTTIAVAGSHGKTTISTLIAHIFKQSKKDCNAFLGGISKNYKTNLLLSDNSNYAIVEADEFDRSFLQLSPFAAVITAIDADHLDIYFSKEELIKSFNLFAKKLQPNGFLLLKNTLVNTIEKNDKIKIFTYSLNLKSDFYANNIKIINGLYNFDIVTPNKTIENLNLGIPGLVNVENAVAAVSIAYLFGIEENIIRESLQNFKGIIRRFDYQIKNNDLIFIDDYAHHPEEIKATINSIKEIYPDKKITGIFQPHLFSRTRDLAEEFANSLELLDRLVLLDIYPARELPIEGISSKIILDKVNIENKSICSKNELFNLLKNDDIDILLTLGAGDIDSLVEPIKNILLNKIK